MMNQQTLPFTKMTSPFVQWLVASLFFWVPINKAPFNIHFFLVFLCFLYLVLTDSVFRTTYLKPILVHPLTLSLASLFILYLLSLSYTVAPSDIAAAQVYRHRFLLYPIFLLPFLFNPSIRQKALWFLFAACVLILFLSYLVFFNVIPHAWYTPLSILESGGYGTGSVFQDYLRQGIQMSWLFGFSIWMIVKKTNRKLNYFLWVIVLLTVLNLMFVLQGRIGYLLVGSILCFYCFRWLGLKGVFIGIVACLFIFLTAYYLSSSFEKRVAMTLEQIQNPAALEEDTHAISNPRVLMWKLVLKTFPEHPLLGYGVRGYWVVANTVPSELDQTAKGLTDPHNQFLFILSELGLIGLTVFLAGLAYLLRFSWQQKDQYNATLMQLSLIIFCIAGLTNVHFNMVYPYQFFIGFLCLAFAVKPVRSLS